MREIKFKVWVESILQEESGIYTPSFFLMGTDVNGKGWVDKIHTTKDGVSYKFKDDTCKFTLLQYTGLHDSSGREIYESDILRGKLKHRNMDEPFLSHSLAVVVWYQENAEYQLVDDEEYVKGNLHEPAYILDDSDGWQSLEIVGNIYETPELLK